MKIDLRPLVSLLFAIAIAIILLIGMSGCSASYHLNKFYKKGGKIEQVEKTVTLYDTIVKDGDTVIIPKFVSVECPEPITPPTRYELKYKYKYLRDSIEVEKVKIKYVYKTAKTEKKAEVKQNPLRQIKSFIMWAVLLVVLLFAFNWISKK